MRQLEPGCGDATTPTTTTTTTTTTAPRNAGEGDLLSSSFRRNQDRNGPSEMVSSFGIVCEKSSTERLWTSSWRNTALTPKFFWFCGVSDFVFAILVLAFTLP